MSAERAIESLYTRDAEGRLHSFNDQPADRSTQGRRVWYSHGTLHRDGDKPAIEDDWDGRCTWWRHGMRHREAGPAIVYAYRGSEWWLFDTEVSERVHRRLVQLPARWRRRHYLHCRRRWLAALDAHLVPDLARIVVDHYLNPNT